MLRNVKSETLTSNPNTNRLIYGSEANLVCLAEPRKLITLSTMLTAQKQTETELRYVVKLELNLHEKMLVMAALENHSNNQLNTAEIFSDSGSSASYFADAGRLQLIRQKVSQAITK